jgi:glycosyltransferase involved in cell wall biosynthesis
MREFPEFKKELNLPSGARIERDDNRSSAVPPALSIIVPSRDGSGGGLIERLKSDLKKQSFKDYEFILVIGDNRQGRAINNGVRSARGRIIMTMDDDTVLLLTELLERIVAVIDADPKIGMAGASCIVPPDASDFQHRACREIPRRFFPVLPATADSDMVQHPCLAMPKKVFEEVRGEDEELIRGLDPLLRYKVRLAEYRVVIVGRTAIAHMLPPNFPAVLKQYARNGRGSAFARKYFANRIYESARGFEGDAFEPVRPLWFRAFRKCGAMILSAARMEYIRLGAELAYTFGYISEYLFGSEKP